MWFNIRPVGCYTIYWRNHIIKICETEKQTNENKKWFRNAATEVDTEPAAEI